MPAGKSCSFGDSLYDAGNNNFINTTTDSQANFPPYGEIFFRYPSGRFSDGRLIPDFIAEFANLPLIQPYLYPGYQRYVDGVNFASAGAGALSETHQGLAIDLKNQLRNFKRVTSSLRQTLGYAETRNLLAKAVYLFSVGSNDYLGPLSVKSNIITLYTPQKYAGMVVANISTVIKEIYNEGGRKFAFLDLPPLGCLPLARALVNGTQGSCLDEASAVAALHNAAVSVELQNLEKQLDGFKYSLNNFYVTSLDVINNPSKYGFKDSSTACCGSGPFRGIFSCGGKRAIRDFQLCEDPNQYVFFDSIHPTQRTNEILSQIMWSGNQSVSSPYNLKALFEL